MSHTSKPKLSINDQVDYLENKGVSFTITNKSDANNFLTNNSYFYKLKSYSKNFDKRTNNGTYTHLEFAYLKELSTLDLHFRRFCLRLTLDIEHTLKTKLIRDFNQNPNCDGYEIVENYLEENSDLSRKLREHRPTGYTAKDSVLNKYEMDLAIWNFIEIVEFGNFINFCNYYYSTYPNSDYQKIKNMLWSVKCIRNSSAHNNCLLHNLRPNVYSNFSRNQHVTLLLTNNLRVSRASIQKRMSIPTIHDFIISLLVYKQITQSKNMINFFYKDLHTLINIRFRKNQSYFRNNPLLQSNYNFLRKVIILLKKL